MTIAQPRYALFDHATRSRVERVWTIFAENTRLRGLRTGPLLLVGFGFTATFVPLLLTEIFASFGLLQGPQLSSFYQAYESPVLLIFTMLMSTMVGAGIVADDLRSKAISLYLSRPITILDYLVGKSAVVGLLLALLAILPGLLTALIVGLLGYVTATVAAEAAAVFLGVGALTVLTFTGVAVLLSTLTDRKSFSGAGIFALLFSVEIVSLILAGATRDLSFEYLSPWEDVLAVARAGFNVSTTPGSTIDPLVALTVLLVLIPVLFVLAYLRLSRLEVVTD
ncbi:MAG: ABC transporter permease subunit [Euryarchaeota archaeon]|nr:ABC transporter permease subunit [Euryarchaeota archaeon]MDE1836453.1 ABC transporter permease subunit [Euryarchaeota archaeon]MDE1879032.1 ABC transporter permease subunit [Euryarchaeota archaeon]MDE2044201.1 ABC transporter permease subunit [Thermoplasmata archaeon]